jgi:putative membrane protein
MKQLIGSLALACALTSIVIAGQQPAEKKPTGAKPATPDAPFVGTAAMDSLAEIELGRLATRNAAQPAVKQFGQRMVDDHQKAVDELKGLAAKKDVTLATELDDQHRATYDALAKVTGVGFDKTYMAETLKAHLAAVALFQEEVKRGEDPEVKAWAAKVLPTLQEHVKIASTINARLHKPAKNPAK